MSVAELVYEQVRSLPDALAREVLDFAAFLHARGEHAASRDLVAAQAGPLERVWDNDDDRVWDEL